MRHRSTDGQQEAQDRSNPAIGRFTSEAAAAKFLAAYDAAFTLWPSPRQEFDVETPYGTTYVHRYGEAEGAPIVLLHGSASNAAQWYPNVAVLGEAHTVFAVDTLGDPGRSVQRAPIHEPATSAAWLDDVLIGLGLNGVHLVGHSYGGWLALNQALHRPERLISISLIDPGGLSKVGLRFYASIFVNALAGLAPRICRPFLARWLRNPVLVVPEMLAVIFAGAAGFRVNRPAPLPLTDDEIRAIRVPTLLLLGEHSALLRPTQVRDRVNEMMPRVQVEIIAETGHGPNLERPDEVNQRILDFIDHRRQSDKPKAEIRNDKGPGVPGP